MFINSIIIIFAILSGIILFLPKLAKNTLWRATITPLASIIGSGFLILGPILVHNFGAYAPLAMLLLCFIGFAFGHAIRFNINARDINLSLGKFTKVETIASWVLAFAYIISVAYYLNLFGAFAHRALLSWVFIDAKIITSIIFIFILLVGWLKGFTALERLEQYSVSLKLTIIIALLAGLAVYNVEFANQQPLVITPMKPLDLSLIFLVFGLTVTIQGFETSRYLGNEYDAKTRIKSMLLSQYISSIIYLLYIIFIAYVFKPEAFGQSETAIIDMMVIISPILPFMLIIAALSAQFSASISDTGGAGGLIGELTNDKMPEKYAYALLVVIGLLLTWNSNIFIIIAYASRAFALYYAIQATIAAAYSVRCNGITIKTLLFITLALLGFIIAIFGISAEH